MLSWTPFSSCLFLSQIFNFDIDRWAEKIEKTQSNNWINLKLKNFNLTLGLVSYHISPPHIPLSQKFNPFCQSTEELFLRRSDARLSPSAFPRALVELFETESRPALKHPQTRCLGKGIWPAAKLEACETTQKGHISKKDRPFLQLWAAIFHWFQKCPLKMTTCRPPASKILWKDCFIRGNQGIGQWICDFRQTAKLISFCGLTLAKIDVSRCYLQKTMNCFILFQCCFCPL